MLTKQLKALQGHLNALKLQNKQLTKEQKQLLHELNFIDKSELMEVGFTDYAYEEVHLESFAVASGICPNCGKRY